MRIGVCVEIVDMGGCFLDPVFERPEALQEEGVSGSGDGFGCGKIVARSEHAGGWF